MRSTDTMASYFLLVVISTVLGQNCPSFPIPSNLVSSAVFLNTLNNHTVYKLSAIAAGQNEGEQQDQALLLPAQGSTCPDGCTYELLSYSSPKNDSILHVRGQPYPLLVPSGYRPAPSATRLACAMQDRFCGATIPVYRYYRIVLGGIIHAYSFKQTEIPNFVRELIPMCYAWPSASAQPAPAALDVTPAVSASTTPPAL